MTGGILSAIERLNGDKGKIEESLARVKDRRERAWRALQKAEADQERAQEAADRNFMRMKVRDEQLDVLRRSQKGRDPEEYKEWLEPLMLEPLLESEEGLTDDEREVSEKKTPRPRGRASAKKATQPTRRSSRSRQVRRKGVAAPEKLGIFGNVNPSNRNGSGEDGSDDDEDAAEAVIVPGAIFNGKMLGSSARRQRSMSTLSHITVHGLNDEDDVREQSPTFQGPGLVPPSPRFAPEAESFRKRGRRYSTMSGSSDGLFVSMRRAVDLSPELPEEARRWVPGVLTGRSSTTKARVEAEGELARRVDSVQFPAEPAESIGLVEDSEPQSTPHSMNSLFNASPASGPLASFPSPVASNALAGYVSGVESSQLSFESLFRDPDAALPTPGMTDGPSAGTTRTTRSDTGSASSGLFVSMRSSPSLQQEKPGSREVASPPNNSKRPQDFPVEGAQESRKRRAAVNETGSQRLDFREQMLRSTTRGRKR